MDALSPYHDISNDERIRQLDIGLNSGLDLEPKTGSDLACALSVVILNLDRPDLILPLCEQLKLEHESFAKRQLSLEIVIGDTGSRDPAVLRYYETLPSYFKVVRDLRYHFSRNNNELARQHCRGRALLFLNNDVILPRQSQVLLRVWDELMKGGLQNVIGAYLFFPDGSLQHGGIHFLRTGQARGMPFHPAARESLPVKLFKDSPMPAVTGAFLALSRENFYRCGAFDSYYDRECQDVHLCLSAHRLGLECKILNLGNIVHIENATRPKGDESQPDRSRFLRKWRSYIEAYDLA